ncbi:TPA: hypothetical protein QCX89_003201 [Bacillus cereus]|nr:hypothetical protein [Bacillus cereus]
MLDFLLTLLKELAKVFCTVLVTAYANKLVKDFSKRKRTTQRRKRNGGSRNKKK